MHLENIIRIRHFSEVFSCYDGKYYSTFLPTISLLVEILKGNFRIGSFFKISLRNLSSLLKITADCQLTVRVIHHIFISKLKNLKMLDYTVFNVAYVILEIIIGLPKLEYQHFRIPWLKRIRRCGVSWKIANLPFSFQRTKMVYRECWKEITLS